jgi:hypothetical protein
LAWSRSLEMKLVHSLDETQVGGVDAGSDNESEAFWPWKLDPSCMPGGRKHRPPRWFNDLRGPQNYVIYRPSDDLVHAACACVLGAYWGN